MDDKAADAPAQKEANAQVSLLERFADRIDRFYADLTVPGALVLILAIGVLARGAHLLVFDLEKPLIMGGLYLEFANQIAANGYVLPERIPFYTEGGIAFLYPPLAFYLTAVFVHGFGLPPGYVINILPVALSVLTIPLFYRLAERLTPGWREAALATFVFALLPNAVAEQIEAAGLTEALGTLMLVLFLTTLIDFYRQPDLRRALIGGGLLGLCALSAPGSAVAGALTAILCAAVMLLRPSVPRVAAFRLLAVMAVTSFAVASPYLVHVIMTGSETFASAVASEMGDESGMDTSLLGRAWSLFGSFGLVDPPAFLWQFLACLGLLLAIVEPRLRVVALWVLAVFILIPREGQWLVAPGIALLAACGFTLLFEQARKVTVRQAHAVSIMAGIVLIAVTLIPYSTPFRALFGLYPDFIKSFMIRKEAHAAFDWARDNTPPDARFLVLTNNYTLELAPYEMRRTVINVRWGTEFDRAKWDLLTKATVELVKCDETVAGCVRQASRTIGASGPLYLLADRTWWLRDPGPEGVLEKVYDGEKVKVFRVDVASMPPGKE